MSWTPKEVEGIRKLKGAMSAVAVAAMYKCNPESVRKLWRGETYKQQPREEPLVSAPPIPTELQSEADALLAELFTQQNKGQGEPQ